VGCNEHEQEWIEPWTGVYYTAWKGAGVDYSTGVHDWSAWWAGIEDGLKWTVGRNGLYSEVDHVLELTMECGSWTRVDHGLEYKVDYTMDWTRPE